jgi:hypothetical protein
MRIGHTLNIIRGGKVEHGCDLLGSLWVADANSSQNLDKVKWAQTNSVIATRHSIIADADLILAC